MRRYLHRLTISYSTEEEIKRSGHGKHGGFVCVLQVTYFIHVHFKLMPILDPCIWRDVLHYLRLSRKFTGAAFPAENITDSHVTTRKLKAKRQSNRRMKYNSHTASEMFFFHSVRCHKQEGKLWVTNQMTPEPASRGYCWGAARRLTTAYILEMYEIQFSSTSFLSNRP
jgi:hypothetical protein